MLSAQPYWLSEQGYCDAGFEDIEMDDVLILNGQGIYSHWLSCEWPEETGRALMNGEQYINTTATCSNATSSWQADLEFVRQPDDSLKVHQETGGISPIRFFHCVGA